MNGVVIRNFALGVLGIDLQFDVDGFLYKAGYEIQRFVGGVLGGRDHWATQWDSDNLPDFRFASRDQALAACTASAARFEQQK